MGDLLNIAVQRLSTIQFEHIGKKIQESHHVLIREYFRRINVFIDTLGINVDKYPIFRISKALGKDLDVSIFNICPKVKEVNPEFRKYCALKT